MIIIPHETSTVIVTPDYLSYWRSQNIVYNYNDNIKVSSDPVQSNPVPFDLQRKDSCAKEVTFISCSVKEAWNVVNSYVTKWQLWLSVKWLKLEPPDIKQKKPVRSPKL